MKDACNKIIEEEIVELEPTASYDEIDNELDKASFEDFCNQLDFLTKQDDPKAQALFDTFRKGWKEEYSKIRVMERYVLVKNLRPTQNVIYARKSLKKFLSGEWRNSSDLLEKLLSKREARVDKSILRAIVVCEIDGEQFIIDGHHRWSKIYLFNPEASMKAYVISNQTIFPTSDDVLKFAQGTITSINGKSPIKNDQPMDDWNLYDMEEKDFRSIVLSYISNKNLEIIENCKLTKGVVTDANSLCDYLWGNVKTMRKEAEIATFHDRKYMPQFNKEIGTPVDAIRKIAAESLDPDLLSSFDINDRLCPVIWDSNTGNMVPEVRDSLIQIARDFVASMEKDFPAEKVGPDGDVVRKILVDVIVVGSITSYNYSRYSDIDLHILVDMSRLGIKDPSLHEICKMYFWHCKKSWNEAHDGLRVKGFGVELYVQDVSEENATNGIYSLLKNEWLKTPDKMKGGFDQTFVSDKAQQIMDKIEWLEHALSSTTNPDLAKRIFLTAKSLKEKIMSDRKSSINGNAGDEMANDNIVFKILRRTGHLERLNAIIDDAYDTGNTLVEFLGNDDF